MNIIRRKFKKQESVLVKKSSFFEINQIFQNYCKFFSKIFGKSISGGGVGITPGWLEKFLKN